MKAITIHQPWAQLIALGEKHFETRSWSTKHRGRLAIHAGQKVDKEACLQEPFKSVLAKHGYNVDNLPLGVIVATCRLTDCLGIGVTITDDIPARGDTEVHWFSKQSNEYMFGWFSQGRKAWKLEDIVQLPEPVPVKGQQGLWNWVHA